MIDKNSYISTYINTADNQIKNQKIDEAKEKRKNAELLEDPETDVNLANVKKYVTSEMSLQLYGPVSDEVLAKRTSDCMTCDQRFDSGNMSDSIGFCRACGCGVTQRARLSVKLTMPASTCPKNKWTPSDGRHHSIKDRVKSWIIKKIIG
jgi:hypothetical protein